MMQKYLLWRLPIFLMYTIILLTQTIFSDFGCLCTFRVLILAIREENNQFHERDLTFHESF